MRTVITQLAAGGVLFFLLLAGACSSGEAPTEAPGATADTSEATPAESSADDPGLPDRREVVAESLPYAEVRDELVHGYFAFPADMVDPLPAVIVVHDRWGLNEDIRLSAERLAASGYIVLAIDLFLGETAGDVSVARDLEIGVLEDPQRVSDNIGQAIEFIRASSRPPGMAILGFGLGGSLALNAAIERPDALDAAVSFYGQVITDQDNIAKLEVPFTGFFAESDRAVPVSTVRDFQSVTDSLGLDVRVRILEDARRGFAAPSESNYDAEAMNDAWAEMLEFLETRFSAGA